MSTSSGFSTPHVARDAYEQNINLFNVESSPIYTPHMSEHDFFASPAGPIFQGHGDPSLMLATHEELVQSRNPTYLAILQRIKQLEQAHARAEAERDESRQCYQQLLQRLPAVDSHMLPANNPVTLHCKLEDTKCKYWTRSLYHAAHGRKATKPDYLEDDTGTRLGDEWEAAMGAAARRYWRGMSEDGTAPPTWGVCDNKVHDAFFAYMYTNFPQISLCENGWKLQFWCTLHYPSWAGKNLTSKTEPGVRKRSRSPTTALSVPERETKRIRSQGTITSGARLSVVAETLPLEDRRDEVKAGVPIHSQPRSSTPLPSEAPPLPSLEGPPSPLSKDLPFPSSKTPTSLPSKAPTSIPSNTLPMPMVLNNAISFSRRKSKTTVVPLPLGSNSVPATGATSAEALMPTTTTATDANLATANIATDTRIGSGTAAAPVGGVAPPASDITRAARTGSMDTAANISATVDGHAPPVVPAVASAPSQRKKSVAGQAKQKMYKPNANWQTPSNLFGIQYISENPAGITVDQFNTAWDNLSTEEKQRWECVSKTKKAEKKAKKPTVQG